MYVSDTVAGLRILCLDRDREWLNIMSRELKSAGVRSVDTSTNPQKILDLLKLGNFDLVLSNHNMKFIRFLRRSKASPSPEVPVIMVTSKVSPENVYAMRDAGVNEIAVKPCSIKLLVDRIEAVAESPRDFVNTDQFIGPDRRRKDTSYAGPERRNGED